MSSKDISQPTDLSVPVCTSKSVLKHTDTVGALPSMESSSRIQAAKKLSHPGPVTGNPRISVGHESTNPRVRGTICNFIPCIPDGGFRIKRPRVVESQKDWGREKYTLWRERRFGANRGSRESKQWDKLSIFVLKYLQSYVWRWLCTPKIWKR